MASESAIAPRPQPDLLDILWRSASSNVTTVALLAVLAAALGLAAIVPQQPDGTSGATAEYWLTSATGSLGTLGPAARALGLFTVFSSPWFQGLLALLAYHLLLRLAGQLRHAWQIRRASPWPPIDLAPQPVFRDKQPEHLALASQHELEAAGYRRLAVLQTAPERFLLYGLRRPAAMTGPALAYSGALLILLGLLVNTMSGWSVSQLPLAPGSLASAGPGGWLEVKLEGLTGPDASPSATVALTTGNGQAARARVGYTRPSIWGNLWLVQRSSGPALAVTAQDGQGRPVALQAPGAGGRAGGATHVMFTTTQAEQVFAVPSRNLAFRVVSYPALPERGIPETVFLIEAYRGADPTPALSQLVRDQASIALDGVNYAFSAERHAVLSLSYLPGMLPLAVGAILLLAATVVCLWAGSRQIWISLAPHGAGTQGLVRAAGLLEVELERMQMARALETGDGSEGA